ncbi:hypothetical protein [Noviherbaspirillum autotrophicum]|uniref:Uncharacterized protein n=1 Tax=Noviherbaspirillum autotrophicum TaxID=709839 RepID=A0A0C2BR63_9BURK|nr:hypothetical protein [Noviherbaspirillum autotrophicum]KIF80556.1 hypothetical protein TSA66_06585 [Noviherbaspirillum autotrophicum]
MKPSSPYVFSFLLAAFAGAAHAAAIQPLRAIAHPGGALEPGTYACRQQYNPAGYTDKVIEVTSATAYAYKGSQRYPGAMTYDAQSGKMVFTSGKLAGAFEAVYGRRDNGWPIFILIDRELAPKADAYDYCARRAGK